MVEILLPAPFRPYAGGKAALRLAGDSVGAVLAELLRQYPGLGPYLFNPAGELRSFVHIFLDGEDIQTRQGLATPLADGDVIRLIPSIAGG